MRRSIGGKKKPVAFCFNVSNQSPIKVIGRKTRRDRRQERKQNGTRVSQESPPWPVKPRIESHWHNRDVELSVKVDDSVPVGWRGSWKTPRTFRSYDDGPPFLDRSDATDSDLPECRRTCTAGNKDHPRFQSPQAPNRCEEQLAFDNKGWVL